MTPPSIDKDEHTNYKKKDPYQVLKLGEKYSEKDLAELLEQQTAQGFACESC